jgi:hypothetical protein
MHARVVCWLGCSAAACGSSSTSAPYVAGSTGAASCPIGTPNDATVTPLSNDSAELDGPTFGQGTDPNDALRKLVRADLMDPNPGLTLDPFTHYEAAAATRTRASRCP